MAQNGLHLYPCVFIFISVFIFCKCLSLILKKLCVSVIFTIQTSSLIRKMKLYMLLIEKENLNRTKNKHVIVMLENDMIRPFDHKLRN